MLMARTPVTSPMFMVHVIIAYILCTKYPRKCLLVCLVGFALVLVLLFFLFVILCFLKQILFPNVNRYLLKSGRGGGHRGDGSLAV